MAGHTVIDAILFENDSTSLELQWVYDQDDDPDTVFQEVLSEIKKATGVGSEEQFQIKTKPKSRVISLRTCLDKVLQGKAEKISVIVDQQLQLQLVLLCKPAGKGRTTGATKGQRTSSRRGRQTGSSASDVKGDGIANKLLGKIFPLWPRHTETVLAYKTDDDGNTVLGADGQPQVDYPNSCFYGQCITASEKGQMWPALYQAFKHLLQELCDLDETSARDMINRKASQQAKSIEYAHIAADAAAAAAFKSFIDAAGEGSFGGEAAEQINEAADAAMAAAVPAGVTRRKTLATAEAEADAWQQQYGAMYRKRHEQPELLPVALEPFTALADRRAQARLAGTAQPVSESELNAAAADMQAAPASTMEGFADSAAATSAAAAAAGAVTSRPHGRGGLVARVQARGNAGQALAPAQQQEVRASSGAAAACRAAHGIAAAGQQQAHGAHTTSWAAEQQHLDLRYGAADSMRVSFGGSEAGVGQPGVAAAAAAASGRLSTASADGGSMAAVDMNDGGVQDLDTMLDQHVDQQQQQQQQQHNDCLQDTRQQSSAVPPQNTAPPQPQARSIPGLLPTQHQVPGQQQTQAQQHQHQQQQQHPQQQQPKAQSCSSAAASAAGAAAGRASSTAHSRQVLHDQHPTPAAAPAAAGADKDKGSPGAASFKQLIHLLGTKNISTSKLEEMGMLRNTLAAALKSGQRPTGAQLRQDAEKGLLPLLQTAGAKVAAQKGKDLDGNVAAGERLKQQAKSRAAGKKRKGEKCGVDAPAGGSKQQRKKKQQAGGSSRQKRKQQESEEEAAISSSEGDSSEVGEFEGSDSDGSEGRQPEVMTAAAAAEGLAGRRGRRAGAGTHHKYDEYES